MVSKKLTHKTRGRTRQIVQVDREVFNFIVDYKLKNGGDSPSMREIVANTEITSTGHLTAIFDKLALFGLIQINPADHVSGTGRSIVVSGMKTTFEGERL